MSEFPLKSEFVLKKKNKTSGGRKYDIIGQ